MDTIEIAACTDHRFIMQIGVMMHSVCRNNQDQDLRFHVIIDESVTEEDKADLKDVATGDVCFYDVDSRVFNSMPLIGTLSYATYYRLLIPQILPDDIDKVLFLDGDIIVRHSLRPLWETDINEYALAAVTDSAESTIEIYNRLEYSPNLGYFNAGVLLINLNYWRVNNIRSEIESFIKNHVEKIFCCDQDILNYVLRERKKTLPLKYNSQAGYLWTLMRAGYNYWKYEKEVLEAREDPVILHFTDTKPWIQGSNHPYKSTFIKYQNETKWKGRILKRPFLTKVRSRVNNVIVRGLTKLRILQFPPRRERAKLYLDLPPID